MKLSELKLTIARQSNIEHQLDLQRDQLAQLLRHQTTAPTQASLAEIHESLIGLSRSLTSLVTLLQEQASLQQAQGLQLTEAINALAARLQQPRGRSF